MSYISAKLLKTTIIRTTTWISLLILWLWHSFALRGLTKDYLFWKKKGYTIRDMMIWNHTMCTLLSLFHHRTDSNNSQAIRVGTRVMTVSYSWFSLVLWQGVWYPVFCYKGPSLRGWKRLFRKTRQPLFYYSVMLQSDSSPSRTTTLHIQDYSRKRKTSMPGGEQKPRHALLPYLLAHDSFLLD